MRARSLRGPARWLLAGLAGLAGLASLGVGLPAAWAAAAPGADLAAAARDGHAAFVVVTQGAAAGTDRAVEIARRAQDLAPGAVVVVVDRADPANADLVERLRVLGAPVPLLLVVAPNGVVAGGALLSNATPEVLVRLIPTPKKADLLLALSHGAPVFVAFASDDQPERSAVFEVLNQAFDRLDRKSATVVVNLKDDAEKAFLAEMKVDPKAEAPVVVVFNAKAQKTEVFRTVPTVDALVKAATKQASCCPGGSC